MWGGGGGGGGGEGSYLLTSLSLHQSVRYVLAVRDYFTHETSLLSFPVGAVIKVEEKEGLDEGQCLDSRVETIASS